MSLWRTLEGRIGEMGELLHTRTPSIAHSVFSCCLRGEAAALSRVLFETLDYTLPPGRHEAKLDALAWHILDRRPKTLLGLAIRASAENFGE